MCEVSGISSLLFLDGYINQLSVRMLVDTGSSVTILKEDIYKRATIAADKDGLQSPAPLVYSAGGDQLEIVGKANVIVKIGSLSTSFSVLVALSLIQECLLGLDFFEEIGCVLNLQKRILEIGNSTISLDPQIVSSCIVVCADTVTIPGHHQMEVPTRLYDLPAHAQKYSYEGMFVPESKSLARHGILFAHSIHSVSPNQEGSVVRILNPLPNTVTIRQHEKLGTIQPVEFVCSTSSDIQSSEKKIRNIKGLLNEANDDITPSEKAALEKLLLEFSDVISTGPNDLGRTSIVKHAIDTGNNLPVNPLHAYAFY